jgi:hypothetical protein
MAYQRHPAARSISISNPAGESNIQKKTERNNFFDISYHALNLLGESQSSEIGIERSAV